MGIKDEKIYPGRHYSVEKHKGKLLYVKGTSVCSFDPINNKHETIISFKDRYIFNIFVNEENRIFIVTGCCLEEEMTNYCIANKDGQVFRMISYRANFMIHILDADYNIIQMIEIPGKEIHANSYLYGNQLVFFSKDRIFILDESLQIKEYSRSAVGEVIIHNSVIVLSNIKGTELNIYNENKSENKIQCEKYFYNNNEKSIYYIIGNMIHKYSLKTLTNEPVALVAELQRMIKGRDYYIIYVDVNKIAVKIQRDYVDTDIKDLIIYNMDPKKIYRVKNVGLNGIALSVDNTLFIATQKKYVIYNRNRDSINKYKAEGGYMFKEKSFILFANQNIIYRYNTEKWKISKYYVSKSLKAIQNKAEGGYFIYSEDVPILIYIIQDDATWSEEIRYYKLDICEYRSKTF